MRAKNRCGAKGRILILHEMIGIEITSLITTATVWDKGPPIHLPEEFFVGFFYPMEQIAVEHRGLVLLDQNGTYLAHGEIWPDRAGELKFIPEEDESVIKETSVKNLLGFSVEIKAELVDDIGAARRLREIKKSFSR
ncbi:MAG TPA: hypothetical protein VFQ60_04135 [Patescibacteria group bacterium]|nr:hypothetical protein [Patescibacteria group bacterium]